MLARQLEIKNSPLWVFSKICTEPQRSLFLGVLKGAVLLLREIRIFSKLFFQRISLRMQSKHKFLTTRNLLFCVSIVILENTGQRKPIFLQILCSDSYKSKIVFLRYVWKVFWTEESTLMCIKRLNLVTEGDKDIFKTTLLEHVAANVAEKSAFHDVKFTYNRKLDLVYIFPYMH